MTCCSKVSPIRHSRTVSSAAAPSTGNLERPIDTLVVRFLIIPYLWPIIIRTLSIKIECAPLERTLNWWNSPNDVSVAICRRLRRSKWMVERGLLWSYM